MHFMSWPAIVVYVDETYFGNQTGVIQAAIPIQKDLEKVFDDSVKKLLEKYPSNKIQEFKASKISKGNRVIYEIFLQRIINVNASIGDQSSLRPIVTVEGIDRHNDINNVTFINAVTDQLAKHAITDEPQLGKEFSRQVWWLYRFFEKICQSQIANEFEFVFDNKHQYAQKCLDYKAVILPNRIPILRRRWEVLSSIANIILKEMHKPPKWFPKISKFTFNYSENNYFLQSCDLFANLFYNALKYESGIRNKTVELKRDMLQCVIPSINFDRRLVSALEIGVLNNSYKEVFFKDKKLSGCFRLSPENQS